MGVGDQCNSSVELAFGTNRMVSTFFFSGLQRKSTGQNQEHLMNNKFEILSLISVLTSEIKILSPVFFMLLKCL